MDHFLPLAEVERLTSLKKSKLYEMVKNGEFPRQRKLTERRRAWLASEVEAWIDWRRNWLESDTGSRTEARRAQSSETA